MRFGNIASLRQKLVQLVHTPPAMVPITSPSHHTRTLISALLITVIVLPNLSDCSWRIRSEQVGNMTSYWGDRASGSTWTRSCGLEGLWDPDPNAQYPRVIAFVDDVLRDWAHREQQVTELSINDSRTSAVLACGAEEPTEWMMNDEQQLDNKDRFREESTELVHECTPDCNTWYVSWIHIDYKSLGNWADEVYCRSWHNKNNTESVTVRLTRDERIVRISKHGTEISPAPPPKPGSGDPCHVSFVVAVTQLGFYWRCTSADEDGLNSKESAVKFYECATTAYCANTFRDLKARVKACVNVMKAYGGLPGWYKWTFMPKGRAAGVAVCQKTTSLARHGAVEYFLDARPEETRPEGKLGFSNLKVPPGSRISLELAPNGGGTYYAGEEMKMNCEVPKYGFADAMLADLVVFHQSNNNNNRINFQWDRRVEERDSVTLEASVNLRSEGVHFVRCKAHVWGTMALANKSMTVQVRNVTPPYFKKVAEIVRYEDEQAELRIACDALGDPTPTVNWLDVSDILQDVRITGNELVITQVDAKAMPKLITCKAVNKFNNYTIKSFKMQQKERSNVVFVVVGVGLGVMVLCGLAALYVRLRRRASAKAQAAETLPTDEDVQEFEDGRQSIAVPDTNGPSFATTEAEYLHYLPVEKFEAPIEIESLPYNSQFEVPKELLMIDFQTVLGEGAYSTVYRGHIKRNENDRNPTPVAVLTTRRGAGIEYFKALMSSLKTLAYLGHSDHLANLVGAYSRNIRNRELYVGVQLCRMSLLDYLQDEENRRAIEGRGTSDLVRWAAEIAAGMEFVSSRRIVHADLAARNVLLSFDNHAKIGDFGLARQMIDYVYVLTTQDCPRPWKWMAIECFARRTFTTKSDVWAYGVTLFELFSVGGVPYEGIGYSPDFVQQLVDGLRLPQPEYASDAVYEVMRSCWTPDPKQRSNFTMLKEFFHCESNS